MSKLARDEARLLAERFLDEQLRVRFPHEIVIVDSGIKKVDEGWLFPYDGKAYVESHDVREIMAGNIPLIVNEVSGEVKYAG
ncbi:YrhB domain-containing protein [Micromonospora sp. NPDC048947]|uniref:YrhB domain-containing protein n=1 Tax=Micromonospora sp. NPDC048947 TaxID=3154826 RepID=UPI0033CC60D2